MREPETVFSVENARVFHLPPLILHPFSDAAEVERLGAILGEDEPALRLLKARYAEIRMLCFIGKDLNRWIGTCREFLSQNPDPSAQAISESNLIALLLLSTPDAVRSKLTAWGVQNFESVFSRALGLSYIFCHAPDPETLAVNFIENFREYADLLYRFRADAPGPGVPVNVRLEFDLFASKEYLASFEKDWSTTPE